MANSETLTTPKDFKGMGILNTRLVNDCMLVK
jgi:hypothetical protein